MVAEALVAVLGMMTGIVTLTWGLLLENSVQKAQPVMLEYEQTTRKAA